MKQACRQRLNIVKVISHKSWHLSKKSKKAIYYALVRSLMEYASFIFATLSQEYKNAINSIQYDALRIIYKRDRFFGIPGNGNRLDKPSGDIAQLKLSRFVGFDK